VGYFGYDMVRTIEVIPASGREVVFAGIVIYRFRDAKIAESWGELDCAGLWR